MARTLSSARARSVSTFSSVAADRPAGDWYARHGSAPPWSHFPRSHLRQPRWPNRRPAVISHLSGSAARSIRVESRIGLQLHAGPHAVRPRIGRASARSGHCLVGLAPKVPTKPRPCDRPPPRCSLPWHRTPHGLLVATPAPTGAPPARNRGRSTSYVTSSQPESGADDTEAMTAGRWGHLSRLDRVFDSGRGH
jgi:hypothetical protein